MRRQNLSYANVIIRDKNTNTCREKGYYFKHSQLQKQIQTMFTQLTCTTYTENKHANPQVRNTKQQK